MCLMKDKLGRLNEKPEAEAGEILEVLVQSDKGDAVGAGAGGEVGVHPDFRRGGRKGRVFLPVGDEAWGLLQVDHLRQGEELLTAGPSLIVGDRKAVIAGLDGRRGDEPKVRLLGGPAEGYGLCGTGLCKCLTGYRMMRMPVESKGQPDTGIKEARCNIQGLAG